MTEQVGAQAMAAAGLDMKTGQFNLRPRRCRLCGGDHVTVESVAGSNRIYGCDDCGALEVLSSSRPVPGKRGAFYAGWHFGTKQPGDWNPGFLQSMRQPMPDE